MPVTESVEWLIGPAYWRSRGHRAFDTNEVPHLVTNDGVRARRAADVLYTSCEAARRDDRLEESIVVVEMGVGLGLHAKLLLDRFKERCRQVGRDYYDRLTYLATDLAPQTLADVARRETLAGHAGRVRLALLDALRPDVVVDPSTGHATPLARVRAVFHNYLFDVLPFEVLRVDRSGRDDSHERWLRLCLQTRIDDVELARRLAPEAWERLQARGDAPPAHEDLLPFYELFRSERAYFPCTPSELLRGDAAAAYVATCGDASASAATIHLLHSAGAVQALDAALDLLTDDGFVLFSDYGFTTPERGVSSSYHQRYGGSRAMGVNFAELEHHVTRRRGAAWIAPADGRGALLSRLVQRNAQPETEATFRRAFAAEQLESIDDVVAEARAARDRGDGKAANAHYTLAHQQAPECWTILLEWSNLASFVLGDPRMGAELAERALAINPTCSAAVWDEYGDALYALGRRDDAHRAFMRARDVDPGQPRTHVNLAWIEADRDRFEEAIRLLGHALVLDGSGAYRPVILKKLGEILERRDARRARMRRER